MKHRKLLINLVLAASFAAAGAIDVAHAQADPSLAQIYDAASAGHLPQAQQMIAQVLRDHPQSGKAHYVAAELDARGGNIAAARQELARAEQLAPGLPFARPEAVRALTAELSQPGFRPEAGARAETASHFPWGLVLVIGVAVVLVLMLLRRRMTAPAVYTQYPQGTGAAGMPGPFGMPGAPGGMVMNPGIGMGGSGLGSNLASGLAVGAGLAAGEELVHHVLEPHQGLGGVVPGSAEPQWVPPEPTGNGDMGGNDFGVSDPGNWDDGGSGGGGGDDWT
jgi:hypothetical protein